MQQPLAGRELLKSEAVCAESVEEGGRDGRRHPAADAASFDQDGEGERTPEADEPRVGCRRLSRGDGTELGRARLAGRARDIGQRGSRAGPDDLAHQVAQGVHNVGVERLALGGRVVGQQPRRLPHPRGDRGRDRRHVQRARLDPTLADRGCDLFGGVARLRKAAAERLERKLVVAVVIEAERRCRRLQCRPGQARGQSDERGVAGLGERGAERDAARRFALEVRERFAADGRGRRAVNLRIRGRPVGQQRRRGHDFERRAGRVLAGQGPVERLVDRAAHDGPDVARSGVDGHHRSRLRHRGQRLLGRLLDPPVERRPDRLRIGHVEAGEHPSRLARGVDSVDVARGCAGQRPFEDHLESRHADRVALLVRRPQLLQPLGGDLADLADRLTGEGVREPEPGRALLEEDARDRSEDRANRGIAVGPDRHDGHEVVRLDARLGQRRRDGVRVDLQLLLERRLHLVEVGDAVRLEADRDGLRLAHQRLAVGA